MKSSPRQLSRPPAFTVSLLLAVGLLGGTVLGTAHTANAMIFNEDGLFPSSEYAYEETSSSDTYDGYRAEGVPEPTLLAGLVLAGIGLTALRRRPQKQET